MATGLQTTAAQRSATPVEALPSPAAESDEVVTIHSRYGEVQVRKSSIVVLPAGLLGFPQWQRFALIDTEDPRYAQFRLLQSVDEPELCFIVLPIAPRNELIDYADIEAACRMIGIGTAELAVLLLVAVRKSEETVELTANLRAPLLIDAASFRGAQHVLGNERYPVRFPLSGE